jgi:3-methyladenine DNA glycosylase Mpg
VAGKRHRFTEIEFYWNGRSHPDTFTHGDPMQREFGRWYFHRTGGEYRSGTYKGMDLAIGAADAPAGILIRGVERLEPEAELLDGPCCYVDHVLDLTGAGTVAALAGSFDRSVDKPGAGSSPLFVTVEEAHAGRAVYASARVGLSLKRGASPARQKYIARAYRFLSEPDRIKKGKVYLALALHAQGLPKERIAELTGTAASVVARYIEGYEAGRAHSPEEYKKDLGTADLCALLGACQKLLAA